MKTIDFLSQTVKCARALARAVRLILWSVLDGECRRGWVAMGR